jgi:hypothetical protein
MHEISKAIYERGNTNSLETYNYFICGVASALFAYEGQHYTPHKLNSLSAYLTPACLVFLMLSFACGCRQIYLGIIGKKLNKEYVKEHEDCIHLTERIKQFEASENRAAITDKATGKVVSVEILKERRDSKVALKNKIEKKARSKFKWANRFEHFRDVCLIFGFALIITSKIMEAYK